MEDIPRPFSPEYVPQPLSPSPFHTRFFTPQRVATPAILPERSSNLLYLSTVSQPVNTPLECVHSLCLLPSTWYDRDADVFLASFTSSTTSLLSLSTLRRMGVSPGRWIFLSLAWLTHGRRMFSLSLTTRVQPLRTKWAVLLLWIHLRPGRQQPRPSMPLDVTAHI